MARKFARVDVTRFETQMRDIQESSRVAIEEMQRELAEEGKEKMKEIILTNGRNAQWKGPWKSQKTGQVRTRSGVSRVDSGDMINSVGIRIEGGRNLVARSAFGWVRNYEDYFGYQEEGFTHFRSKKWITGMFALRDARLYVVTQVLPVLAKKYQRRIARGIKK